MNRGVLALVLMRDRWCGRDWNVLSRARGRCCLLGKEVSQSRGALVVRGLLETVARRSLGRRSIKDKTCNVSVV